MSDLEDKSPGAAFEIFLKNESLMEKLKLLDFETQFVQKGLRHGLRRDSLYDQGIHGPPADRLVLSRRSLIQLV